MSTTDTDTLTEGVESLVNAYAMRKRRHHARTTRGIVGPDQWKAWEDEARAIIAAEVRKAKAEALREAAGDIIWSAETLPHMTPHDAARGLVRRADRIETGDSDEHR